MAPGPLDAAAVAAFAAARANEDSDLPDPYFDSPKEFFAWKVLPASGWVLLIARDTSARAQRAVPATGGVGPRRPKSEDGVVFTRGSRTEVHGGRSDNVHPVGLRDGTSRDVWFEVRHP